MGAVSVSLSSFGVGRVRCSSFAWPRLFRHPGEGRDPVPVSLLFSFLLSFRRKPSHFVIPAGSRNPSAVVLTFGVDAKTDSRPCGLPSHPCEGFTFSCLCKRK